MYSLPLACIWINHSSKLHRSPPWCQACPSATYSAWEWLQEATRTNAWPYFKAALKRFSCKIRWPISPNPIFQIFRRVTNRERRDERKCSYLKNTCLTLATDIKKSCEIFRFSFHEHCTCTIKLTLGLEPLDISEIKPLCKTGLLKQYAFKFWTLNF